MADFAGTAALLRVAPGTIGIAWLGQGGFAFLSPGGVEIMIDPYLSNLCNRFSGNARMEPAPIRPRAVRADCILFTHDHRDHVDPEAVPQIAEASPPTRFAGPSSCIHRLTAELGIAPDRCDRIDRGESHRYGDVEVTALFADHTADSVGYLLVSGGVRIYLSGDTLYHADLAKTAALRPDLALLCINGRLGNMTAREAATVVREVGAKWAVPMHYGMFRQNTADPDTFVTATAALAPQARVAVLPHGRWLLFHPDAGFQPTHPEI